MINTVLLDLGNVVLGVDFHQVLSAWAKSADVSEDLFHERWQMDAAYKAHETGHIDFDEYVEHLSQLFDINMPMDAWRAGWNAVFTRPYDDVIDRLPSLRNRYRLFAFTNTNDTHKLHWQRHYAAGVAEFEDVFISSDIGLRKPDIDAFEFVCQQMHCAPGDVMFIDDNKDNVTGAIEAGLNAEHTPREKDVIAKLDQLLQA